MASFAVMAMGPRRRDDCRMMQCIGRRDVDRVHVGVAHEFVVGRVGFRDTEALGKCARLLGIASRAGGQTIARPLNRRGQMVNDDFAESDHTPAYWCVAAQRVLLVLRR